MEDYDSRPAQEKKKLARLHFNRKMLVMVVHASHPSYGRMCKIGLQFRPALAKSETYLLNNACLASVKP
jgi:hypothetical protein